MPSDLDAKKAINISVGKINHRELPQTTRTYFQETRTVCTSASLNNYIRYFQCSPKFEFKKGKEIPFADFLNRDSISQVDQEEDQLEVRIILTFSSKANE